MIFEHDKVIIDLKRDRSYQWYSEDGICVCGYAFQDQNIYQGAALANCFVGLSSLEDLLELVKRFNGCFAVIIFIEQGVFACTDRLRSIPLFWYQTENEVVITDRLRMADARNFDISEEGYRQFDHALFVAGNRTLLSGVSQLGAWEYLWVTSEKKIVHKEYWQFSYSKDKLQDDEACLDLLHEKYMETAKRIITLLDGRQAVIPLSGGHDSRRIAYLLVKFGYQNIITYSYGREENEESRISKEVAAKLHIPWHFVEYTNGELKKLLKTKGPEYFDYCGNMSSLPCLQEWYAVKYLFDNGIIDADSIFLPGYGGSLTGSHIPADVIGKTEVDKFTIENNILQYHFSEAVKVPSLDEQKWLRSCLTWDKYMKDLAETTPMEKACALMETYDIKERQAKFICNAVRAYEFYGFQWAMPLFDMAVFEAWGRIPLEKKYKKRMSYLYGKSKYEYPLGEISYAGECLDKEIKQKNLLSKVIYGIKAYWQGAYFDAYLSFSQYMKGRLRTRIRVNGVLIQYFKKEIQKKLDSVDVM